MRTRHSGQERTGMTEAAWQATLAEMIMLLLLFVIVQANFETSGGEKQPIGEIDALPYVPSPGKPGGNPPVVVTAKADGKFELGGNSFDEAGLKAQLVEVKKKDPKARLVVRGAAKVEYEPVAQALAVCKLAGFDKVGLRVRKREGTP